MIKLLQRISNWKFILLFFLFFAYMTFYLFPRYQSQLNKLAGEEVQILDARFSYSISEVNNLFDKLGTEGRALYTIVIGRVDMIYPISYAVFCGLLLALLLKTIWRRKPQLIIIALLPVLGALFDYLENFNTLNLLGQYPNIEEQQVAWGELLTRIKQVILVAAVSLIVLLMIILLVKTIIRRKQKRHTTDGFPST